jgi:transposase
MKNYVGMDLHSTNTVLGMVDEDGKRIYRKKIPNHYALISGELEPFKEKIKGVVVESTYNWYWLVDHLIEDGYTVHLANPSAIKQYEGKKYVNDQDDAFFLADTGLRMSCNDVKKLNISDVEHMFESDYQVLSAQANIATIIFLSERIKEIEKKVLGFIKPMPQFQKLLTIPGIGNILALTISLEVGEIDRFKKVGNYSSYSRCVSSGKYSNGKKKGENNRKNGNKYLSWAYVEAANHAKKNCPYAMGFFQRKAAKKSKIIAIKALAHKIARASYYVMKNQEDYDRQRVFGPIKKQAAAVNQ